MNGWRAYFPFVFIAPVVLGAIILSNFPNIPDAIRLPILFALFGLFFFANYPNWKWVGEK